MFFDPETAPDPDGGDADGRDADSEDYEVDAAALAAIALHSPDTMDHVVEIADMMTMHAAQRLVGIDLARREALADAERHGAGLSNVIERSMRLEVAAALRITEYAANELIVLGEALVHRYLSVLESFSRAGMTERHAAALVEALDSVEPELRERVLEPGIVLADSQPVGSFRRALRKLVETVRAETLEMRHAEALQQRRVIVEPGEDGMSWLLAYMPSVEAHAVHGRMTAIAKVLANQDGETRTLDQLRADVLADILIEGETDVHPPEARGIRASVAVTVPALSLLEGHAAGGDPASVEGVGPIPTSRARELCGDADGWMRVLTHPETGMVLSVGREQYRPPPALRRLVRWRADRCMAPGCGVPASRCEIDHTIAWQDGGDTSLENHAPLCKGHHIVKHHGGWCVSQLPDSGGALEWISPTGRRYVVEPERRVPVFRPQSDDTAPF